MPLLFLKRKIPMPVGVFEKMNFEPYHFVEYPKWITLQDGKTQIVARDKRHELELLANDGTEAVENPGANERNALVSHVQSLEMEIAALKAAKLHEVQNKIVAQAMTAAESKIQAQRAPVIKDGKPSEVSVLDSIKI